MTFSNELVSKLRRLSPEEYETLETSCLKNGIQDPIKVWGNILIDGRHRLEIAQKHDLPYRMEQVAFADEAEATKWIWEFQLGRRNHTEMETHRARAELARLTSIKEAADSHGVSVRTIARDITASAAMDLMDSDLLEKCESGQIVNSMSDWKRYGQLTSEEREKANQKLRSNPELTLREVMPPKNMVLDDDDLAFQFTSSILPQDQASYSYRFHRHQAS